MKNISRQDAVNIIKTLRQLIDGNAEMQGYLEKILSNSDTEKDEPDIICRGVSNGYLSGIIHIISGNQVEVAGDAEELYKCPCCGYKTLTERYDPSEGTGYDICPYCKWEDDGTVSVDKHSSVNRGTISDYRRKMQLNQNMYYINKWYK